MVSGVTTTYSYFNKEKSVIGQLMLLIENSKYLLSQTSSNYLLVSVSFGSHNGPMPLTPS